jgi:L,D-peptidoglycan transpeptidase YkuD (ErfK/YbiS/YcfS/YnhG family)
MNRLLTLMLGLCAGILPIQATALPWDDARQLVLVTTPGWDESTGMLRRFERSDDSWHPVGEAVPVRIGRSGAAWGLGLHPHQPGTAKREGDGRSPAGIFRLGEAFGYAASMQTALPYAPMHESNYCIDVVGSPLYNRIVDAQAVGADAVEGSTEPMRRDLHADGDQRYKLGFVIQHNPDRRQAAGSCIFAHVWKSPDDATAGCTAMTEPVMRQLLDWLDPDTRPVFVLLPEETYRQLKSPWHLPTIEKVNP